MTFPALCVCSTPGRCEAVGRDMTRGMHAECQRNPKFRLMLAKVPKDDPRWQQDDQPPPAQPSLMRRAATFARAAIRHVAAGLPRPSQEEIARRRSICESCDKRVDGKCTVCGCNTNKKSSWLLEQCPIGKWALPVIGAPAVTGDVSPLIEPITRHLLYHIYPVSGNGAWQRNVGRLVERLRIFNGSKIVSIVIDPPAGRKPDPTGPHPPDGARHIAPCDSVETVKAAFGDHAKDIHFLILENDPHLREVVSLVPMLERLPHGPGDVTLYAQAKGTTRHHGSLCNHWSDLQYIIYFDYWLLVLEQLKRFPVTGAFKKLGAGWSPDQAKSDWHYSGSWFWFRNADLFARDWRTVDQFWSGVEPYPSQQFLADESGCLFMEGQVPALNLYSSKYWKRTVDPLFANWRRTMKPYETPF